MKARSLLGVLVRNAVFALPVLAPAALAGQVDYARAEQMLGPNLGKLVFGTDVAPQWLGGTSRFWYRVTTPRGAEFILVDPALNSRRPVFDNVKLAAAISVATDSAWEPSTLPFTTFKFVDEKEQRIELSAGKRRFTCDLGAYRCVVGDTVGDHSRGMARSPDGKWEAFVHDYNLAIRPAGGGDTVRLTTDGEERWAYGLNAYSAGVARIDWSPDSRKIAINKPDYRNIKTMVLYSATTPRPTPKIYPYALPGDSAIPRGELHIIDVASKSDLTPRTAPGEAMLISPYLADSIWAPGSNTVYVISTSRDDQKMALFAVDATTGAARRVLADSAGYERAGQRILHGRGEVVWSSWRDGWLHFYRFGIDGTFRNQITAGSFSVEGIEWVDEAAGLLYFTAAGREPGRMPYHAYLYRVGLDGAGLTLLTPEDGDHAVTFAPGGKYFVDTYSRPDVPPITVLRSSADGRVLRELERADASRLREVGWRPPEVVRAHAPDGLSEMYGLLYKPSFFDSTKSYPIVDHIYPHGSVSAYRRTWGFAAASNQDPQALAELGFIVLELQGRGSRGNRTAAFKYAYQGRMGQNALPDHVAAIQQLGARHRWIDLNRVGIYGISGGGFASTAGILRYPDFFKVAVSSAGNHDNRSYGYYWGERYQGLLVRDPKTGKDNYEAEANITYAKNLKGKLLLMHGDADDNVHPTNTLRLVHALIEADKEFDMLILPDRGHNLWEPYVVKRTWDYFVRHLMGVEPPPYVMAR